MIRLVSTGMPTMDTDEERALSLPALEVAGVTDVGQKRGNNEDEMVLAPVGGAEPHADSAIEHEGCLLAVADGMGGHVGGREASSTAIHAIVDSVVNSPFHNGSVAREPHAVRPMLERAFRESMDSLRRFAINHTDYEDMGTTMTLTYVVGRRVYLAHVGDSRCYWLHERSLKQMTRDHTVAQAMADEGILTPDAIERSTWRNVLSQCLGPRVSDLTIDFLDFELAPGDCLLLCSDGLNRHVDDDQIAASLGSADSVEAIARDLVARANEGGGADNITVVVARSTAGRSRGAR